MPLFSPDAGRLALRLAAATLGGYALCWAIVDVLCAGLPYDRATRWYLAGQLAPLPLLGTLLWAFAAPGAGRALLWPLVWAAAIAILAWLGGLR